MNTVRRAEQVRLAQQSYRKKQSIEQKEKRLNFYVPIESYSVLKSKALELKMTMKDCFHYLMQQLDSTDIANNNEFLNDDDLIGALTQEELILLVKKQRFWLDRLKALNDVMSKN